MGKIQLLSEHIANQIAAGEVVERPSSVVKELVENSIDAGSTRIDITIEEGGLQLIRVSDNGSGMEAEDTELAFQRHATSKISTNKDLFSIRTLGFRGEALPSIASVSRLECITSSTDSGLARKIFIEGGAIRSVEETAASRGTEVTVKELFFNTPARLKYMKTIQTELGHVSDYIYRLALAHPQIAFSLKHNGNLLLQTLGNGDLVQVIAAIYGTAVGKQMLPIQAESLDYVLSGNIARPEMTRANRGGISTIVNGRYVRNFALNQALMQAYHTLLPINRFPVAVVHISMDPSLVDVNVHPSKLEVRFSKETELTAFVESEVKRALGKQVLIPQGAKPAVPKGAYVQEQLELTRVSDPAQQPERPQQSAPGELHQTERPSQGERTPQSSARSWSNSLPQVQEAASPYRSGSQQGSPARSIDSGRPKISFQQQQRAAESFMNQMSASGQSEAPSLPEFPSLTPIGQLHGTYLVAQSPDGLYLIDQHAAHERIHYEYYYERFGNPTEASQELLVPITLEFTPSEAGIIAEKLALFEQSGVYLEAFGGNTFLVRSHPHWFPDGDEKSIIEDMCEWILTERKAVDIAKLREKSAILCSCKASIKANQSLGTLEMETLLDRLAECRNPYTCPHGRPIVVSFSNYELEKMFKRVM
ncbi:DNA mismatch repair endonuclease MutL [Paenibacillus sp. GP183]|uniref:DNA mismatch repair endonuclease MutL n=1 Tax=Paenibacillus sp. GP183 TaxID=1882751 RepID=UPI00089BE26E|nr:DNA mismatch repair endonuclease MutL [Paenibacillus sp. GP183]SEB59940.1 DNA mismatch repair protein MutL [Paenibacillus sp. GP183]